jgi:hypothetical protein
MQDATNTNLGSGKGCPSLLSSAATSYEHRLTYQLPGSAGGSGSSAGSSSSEEGEVATELLLVKSPVLLQAAAAGRVPSIAAVVLGHPVD